MEASKQVKSEIEKEQAAVAMTNSTHTRERRAAPVRATCASTDNSADCGALTDCWNAWGGNPTSWPMSVASKVSFCSWAGVTCTAGRVTSLCVLPRCPEGTADDNVTYISRYLPALRHSSQVIVIFFAQWTAS